MPCHLETSKEENMIDHRPVATPKPVTSFVREHHRYDRMLAGFEKRLLDTCVPRRGLHVLDVGCGAGTTSLEAAQRVTPEGLVLGVDIDADAVAFAARRARSALLPQAQFRCADAATATFSGPGFDRVISRFGVLHFADPILAFANLRKAMVPNGQLGFVCARSPALNPWATRPVAVLQSVLGPLPAPSAGRGPFALADEGRITRILDGAGFSNIQLESIDEPVVLGSDVDDAIEFFFETDLRKINAQLDARQALAIADGLRSELADWQHEEGICSPASAWLVTADRGH
jgi:SAM-dependent methyltransferase